jgi:hypothetical protein
MVVNIAKNIFFNNFCVFWITNERLWWPIGYLYGVLSVVGTLGDTIGYLNTTCWPLEHTCM